MVRKPESDHEADPELVEAFIQTVEAAGRHGPLPGYWREPLKAAFMGALVLHKKRGHRMVLVAGNPSLKTRLGVRRIRLIEYLRTPRHQRRLQRQVNAARERRPKS